MKNTLQNGPTRALYLVRDSRALDDQSGDQIVKIPRDRHWGLEALSERPGVELTPWYVGQKPRGRFGDLAQRVLNQLRPKQPMVFWSRPSRDLAKDLVDAQSEFDVALSMNVTATATLLALKKQGRFNIPIICLLVGTADWLESAPRHVRDEAVDYLSRADGLLAVGHAEVEYLRSLGLEQAEYLPFGIDADYWSPVDVPIEDYVLAIGSDHYRDFDTLVKACPYPMKIMTRNLGLVTVPIPENVTFVQGDTADMKQLIAQARVTVVPLQNSLQPSGQNTIMQAMAMEKPVIISRTRGTWTDILEDGKNCVYVPHSDVQALNEAIHRLFDDPSLSIKIGRNARKAVLEHFEVRHLGEALARSAVSVAGVSTGAVS